jgi:Tautomerase enzyme
MPLARIDLPAGKPVGYARAVADVVYEAMLATLNAPKDDRFQVISEHAPGTLIVDPTYLGIQRSAEALIIQLILNEGRTVEMKKAFYQGGCRWAARARRDQARGRCHQSGRGEEGELVVRQRHRAIRLSVRLEHFQENACPRAEHQGVYGTAREDGRKRPDALRGLWVETGFLSENATTQ